MSKIFAAVATMVAVSVAALGTARAATEPSPSELTARSSAVVDGDGYEASCRFQNFPEFELHYNEDEGAFGLYSVPAVELDKKHSELEVQIAKDGSAQGTIYLNMSVWGDKPGGDRGSALIVGGRRFDLGSAGLGRTTFVLPADAMSALEKASSARLEMTFLDGVSAWNFKVDHLRYFRRALELSKWQCA